jgi:predicted nucleic acid-binding protein
MIRLPTGPLLFDTGIYIRLSRREDYIWLSEDAQIFQRTILTVVAAELYAGTRNHREKRALGKLCRAHHALGHFSSPHATAWIDTGILLCRARSTFGPIHFGHHFRDLLMAVEAVRTEATLVTENAEDFTRWRSLLGSARKTLKLFNPFRTTQRQDLQ